MAFEGWWLHLIQVFDDLDQSKKVLFNTRTSGPGSFWYHTKAKIERTTYILFEMVKFEGIQCILDFMEPDFQMHPRLLLKPAEMWIAVMWCFCPGPQGGVLAKWWTSTWDRHLGLPTCWTTDYCFWPCLIYGVVSESLPFFFNAMVYRGPKKSSVRVFGGSEILDILLIGQCLPSLQECFPKNPAKWHNSFTFGT